MTGQRKLWSGLIGSMAGGLLVAQLFQPPHPATHPPTGRNLLADPGLQPAVHAIFERSCVDCHSAGAPMPWYGHISPVSWFLYRHVQRGRKKLDFLDWPRNDYDLRQNIADSVDDRSMPLRSYCWMHRSALLSAADKKVLEAWADGQ